ncbi:MAG: ECF-type sigma factor, partial [Planctomycetota bacterium]
RGTTGYRTVYDDLYRVAANRLASEAQTLSPSAWVHESSLRLVVRSEQGFENRRHFFGAAAESMRRIVTDHAHIKCRLKRGPDKTGSRSPETMLPNERDGLDLIAPTRCSADSRSVTPETTNARSVGLSRSVVAATWVRTGPLVLT